MAEKQIKFQLLVQESGLKDVIFKLNQLKGALTRIKVPEIKIKKLPGLERFTEFQLPAEGLKKIIDPLINEIKKLPEEIKRIGLTFKTEGERIKEVGIKYGKGVQQTIKVGKEQEQQYQEQVKAEKKAIEESIRNRKKAQDSLINYYSVRKKLSEEEISRIKSLSEEEARTELQSMQRKERMLNSLRTLSYAAIRVGLNIAGVGRMMTMAMAYFIRDAIKFNIEVIKMQQGLGLSNKETLKFMLLGEATGMRLNDLTKNIGNAFQALLRAGQGTSLVAQRIREALSRAGIEYTKLGEKHLTAAEQLEVIRKAYQNLQDPLERAYVGQMIFGSAYEEMIPLLTLSGEKFKEWDKFSESIFGSGKGLSEFNDKAIELSLYLTTLRMSFRYLASDIIKETIPAIKNLITFAGNLIKKFGELPEPVKKFAGHIGVFGPIIVWLTGRFIQFAGSIGILLVSLKSLGIAIPAFAVSLIKLSPAIMGVVIAIGLLIGIYDKLKEWKNTPIIDEQNIKKANENLQNTIKYATDLQKRGIITEKQKQMVIDLAKESVNLYKRLQDLHKEPRYYIKNLIEEKKLIQEIGDNNKRLAQAYEILSNKAKDHGQNTTKITEQIKKDWEEVNSSFEAGEISYDEFLTKANQLLSKASELGAYGKETFDTISEGVEKAGEKVIKTLAKMSKDYEDKTRKLIETGPFQKAISSWEEYLTDRNELQKLYSDKNVKVQQKAKEAEAKLNEYWRKRFQVELTNETNEFKKNQLKRQLEYIDLQQKGEDQSIETIKRAGELKQQILKADFEETLNNYKQIRKQIEAEGGDPEKRALKLAEIDTKMLDLQEQYNLESYRIETETLDKINKTRVKDAEDQIETLRKTLLSSKTLRYKTYSETYAIYEDVLRKTQKTYEELRRQGVPEDLLSNLKHFIEEIRTTMEDLSERMKVPMDVIRDYFVKKFPQIGEGLAEVFARIRDFFSDLSILPSEFGTKFIEFWEDLIRHIVKTIYLLPEIDKLLKEMKVSFDQYREMGFSLSDALVLAFSQVKDRLVDIYSTGQEMAQKITLGAIPSVAPVGMRYLPPPAPTAIPLPTTYFTPSGQVINNYINLSNLVAPEEYADDIKNEVVKIQTRLTKQYSLKGYK